MSPTSQCQPHQQVNYKTCSFTHVFIHLFTHLLFQPFTHSLTHSIIHLPIRSFIHLFIHSDSHWLIYIIIPSFIHASFIRSFLHSFIPSCVHSFIHSCMHANVHQRIDVFMRSFNDSLNNDSCASFISWHFIGMSTPICSVVDAPCHFQSLIACACHKHSKRPLVDRIWMEICALVYTSPRTQTDTYTNTHTNHICIRTYADLAVLVCAHFMRE